MSERTMQSDDVTIRTATIEVKVMKIGNRQVTLAVFRQIPSESIIDKETGQLKGDAWGRVNYHVDCEAYNTTHMHVVWQKGNELRRAIVDRPWKAYSSTSGHGVTSPTRYWDLVEGLDFCLEWWLLARHVEDGWEWPEGHGRHLVRAGGDIERWIEKPDVLKQRAYTVSGKLDESYKDKIRQNLAMRGWYSADVVAQEVAQCVAKIVAYKEAWEASARAIEALDQLYIAV